MPKYWFENCYARTILTVIESTSCETFSDVPRLFSSLLFPLRLCQDILNGAVEGQVKLDGPEAFCLLQDTLSCLASEEIKLASLKSKPVDEEPDGITQQAKNDMVIKKTIISQVINCDRILLCRNNNNIRFFAN